MKSKPVQERIAGGIDQRWKSNPSNAGDIKNLRVEETGLGWLNDRGWEPLIMPKKGTTISLPLGLVDIKDPVRFLSVWSRHNGAEVYYLYERNGKLKYDFGNVGSAASREIILDSDRNIPKSNEPGTQIIPFNRFALIINGNDRPIKFWGRDSTTPFGWSQRPNTPSLFDPEPDAKEDFDQLSSGKIGFVINASTNTIGVGGADDNDISTYKYKVSFISDTGSESPLSGAIGRSWKIDNANQEGYWSPMLSDIPIGPQGTVARRIYRTKNLENSAADIYYLVKQINDNSTLDWLDIMRDDVLLTQAPSENDSIILPQSLTVGASWNGCIWLAGGEENGTKIHFSDRYLPEQFNRFRFFDVGSRDGGAITALVPYYNSLIVFRENSIEAVSAIAEDEYTISTISNDIGTRATNSIVEVPAVGLFFLTPDGVYALQGGQSGAGQITLEALDVSGGLHKEWKRLSEGSLARATATYSKREKEYWVHYPVDGDTENSRGAVYHSQSNSWSLRNLSDPKFSAGTYSGLGMYFTQLATDPEGWIVIGTYPNYPYKSASVSDWVGFPGWGLQVWSANPYWGKYVDYIATNQQEDYNIYNAVKRDEDCLYESVFDDMGDDSIKKRIISVEVEMVTQGYNDIKLSYKSDYAFQQTEGGSASPMLVEQYKTINSEPVWTISGGTAVKNLATWGENWSGSQLCRVRWDIHTGLVGATSWKVYGSEKFHIISYHVQYMDGKQQVITHGGSNG